MRDLEKRRKYRAEWMSKWRSKNPEKFKYIKKKSDIKRRMDVLGHYSKGLFVCNCCGEKEEAFLCLDHINNNGNIERKKYSNGRGGANFYRYLKKNNYPSGYQVLCYNCNNAKHTRGICPHNNNKKTMDENKKVVKTLICSEPNCENEFDITKGEVEFFASKGLDLPKRCPECRARRRKERGQNFTVGNKKDY